MMVKSYFIYWNKNYIWKTLSHMLIDMKKKIHTLMFESTKYIWIYKRFIYELIRIDLWF